MKCSLTGSLGAKVLGVSRHTDMQDWCISRIDIQILYLDADMVIDIFVAGDLREKPVQWAFLRLEVSKRHLP